MHIRLHGFFHKKRLRLGLSQDLKFDISAISETEVYNRLKTSPRGLLDSDARRRLFKYGHNEAVRREKRKLLHEIYAEFANPLIVLLLVLGTFSLIFSDKFSAIIIYVMAAMSGLLSFFQEHRAEKAVEKLNALVRVTAAVVRNGQPKELKIKDLVPGDVVSLSAGDVVPADLRLVSSNDLFLSESSLTGESLPVEKFSRPVDEAKELIKAHNLVFMGSSVVSGTGLGVVFHTGSYTEFGKISDSLSSNQSETGFDRGIKDFTWLMIKAILCMVVVILAINLLDKRDFFESLLFALAVAVGLAPETLPMIVTVNLSKGALDMSKKKVVVKRLDAIQNFGAMDVLCTDKTGTLTMDNVVLERHINIFGQEDQEVFDYGYLNSFYQTGLKNLLDKAVLRYDKPHLQGYEKADEIPFDFTRRIMSVVVARGEENLLISKGAPEEILKRCKFYQNAAEVLALDSVMSEKAKKEYEHLSEQGFRVLGLAFRRFGRHQKTYSTQDESSLVFKGFMAFLDPAKPDAKQTINSLELIGLRIKILTGDNELVTRKICNDLNFQVNGIVLGESLDTLSEKELLKKVESSNIFVRVSPLQKQKIVKALQKNGHTVGFMGDGINDSPALKIADVGISVNNAADVSRESAGIILLEKSLAVLYDGVLEGRKVFGNITKYIRMSSSSNFGNMISMTGAGLILPFLPMLPVQILLNNFLYDLSQIGIPTDGVDKEYLEKPRPWNIDLVKKYMLIVGPVSSIFDFLTYGIMWWVFAGFLHQDLFHTGWFIESLFTQTLVVYVIRTKKIPFIQSRPSKWLVLTSLSVLAIGLGMVYGPLSGFFGFVRPPALYFWLLAGMVLAYLFLVQVVKNWFIRRFEHA